ncbi:cytochrome P450 family protein [Marinactinospora thermotolerans]|uniref:Cytochrome P450 n=1 Tax=Marinactinospora thermotolerans DSM 45154 TaxID=1122192 RepID=A0A1T4LKF6_9ACTN|nr:cytochrome P450 [Marinactinospora thermotolerans]SJZ55205.1 hypothetical protein SAMN02745673_00718 [Marinactinospora thermotolerans DSM 45154]
MTTSNPFAATVDEHPGEPHLASPELISDPYGGYARLREQAPVIRGRYLDGSPIWFVTRFDDVRAVLSDPRFLNNADAAPGDAAKGGRAGVMRMMGLDGELSSLLLGSILETDPPDHTRLRKLVSRTFTVRRVGELRPRVEAITEELLDRLPDTADNGVVDLIEHLAYPLPITVICELVGIPEPDRPLWRDWGRSLLSVDPATFPATVRAVADYIHGLIAARRAAPSDDLLSGLIRTHDEDGDRLTDHEMVSLVLTLVFAGHETTAHLIGNGVAALLTHPDQLALLRADPDLTPRAVNELMRWCGPVQATRLRYAAEDLELAGTAIRAGDAVQVVLVSANRDPRRFPDPDRLDITRDPGGPGESHIGFGHGAHYCLGAALARQEADVALRALLGRFPGLALAIAPEQLEWIPLPANRRLARLPVRW